MSQAVADSVRHLRRVAVSNAYELAPDAEAMAATDRAWWREHPKALRFKGRKFGVRAPDGVESVAMPTGTNSALLALHVAVRILGATRVELYGLDMSSSNGAHYFGAHATLRNTLPHRFDVFKAQFAKYALPDGVEVVNCTPGSALLCYPFRESLCALAS